jgi:lysophospholipase L1-like esterase
MKKLLLFCCLIFTSAMAQENAATNAAPSAPKDDARPVEKDIPLDPHRPVNPALPTLFIIGDSTVENSNVGHVGWGQPLADYFDLTKINVINHAIGGRSSRSFQEEGRWAAVLAQLKPGDFVIMQFGHNDGGSPNDPLRGDRAVLKGVGEDTIQAKNPKTGVMDTIHSYGWYMRKYVTDTKAKKATAIVCSLIPRKIWTPDGKIIRGAGDFGGWARASAQATGGLFVDLNEITAERYDAMGQDKVNALFVDPHTHTNAEGADINAQSIVAGLKGIPKCPLTPYLSAKAAPIAPYVDPGATAPVK